MRRFSILTFAVLLVSCSKVNTGSLNVSVPTDWELKYTSSPDFYSITSPGARGLFMIYVWPQSSADEIPGLVNKLAEGFLQSAKGNSKMVLVSEKYDVKSFTGPHSKGSYAQFQMGENGKTIAAMFLVQVNGKTWTGQFTGPAEEWAQALKVLSDLKARW